MSSFRLPLHVEPIAYAIDLTASPQRKTFNGRVTITAKVKSPCTSLLLHGRGLKIQEANIKQLSKSQSPKIRYLPSDEAIELLVSTPLKKGSLQLTIDYTGQLDQNMHGLYLAQDGPERALVTQCEATDARAIFPCWDEPEFKATLQWTIRTLPGWMVITNGVLEDVKTQKGVCIHTFKPTRKISSYLAALTIGRYEATKPFKVNGTPCRIVCGAGKLEQSTFARAITEFVLPWYEDYFGQKYHYQKLDQVAVPGFDAGAMENIGAIFYRQNRLLMTPGQTSWASEKGLAEVVAHEIAHQWFGNRVTMRWWDDLWLNEAFATWIAYKAMHLFKAEWRIWDDFNAGKEEALKADSLTHTHPIYTPVNSPAEVTELFDVITYEKGGSVLRMLEQYMGEEPFQRGLQSYMARHKDNNASGDDLWDALSVAAEHNIKTLAHDWILKPGFPLVSVETIAGSPSKIRLTQSRFQNSGAKSEPELWSIPIVLRYGVGDQSHIFKYLFKDAQVTLELPHKIDWLLLNQDSICFYRTLYQPKSLKSLLKHGLPQLSATERAGLLCDQWALVQSGVCSIEDYLNIVSHLKNEHDHVVIDVLATHLLFIYEHLLEESTLPHFQKFTHNLLSQQLSKLTLTPSPSEPPAKSSVRATLVFLLYYITRDPALGSAITQLAQSERHSPAELEPNLGNVVVKLAALEGHRAHLATYVETYQQRKSTKQAPDNVGRYLSALPYFIKPVLQKEVLALCLDGTVPQEQLRSVLASMLSRKSTQIATWKFLKANFATLRPKIGSMGISRLIEATRDLPATYHKEIQTFFKQNPVEEATRSLQKALEIMHQREEFKQRVQQPLTDWLQRTL